MGGLREITAPFVAVPPSGARVRTRLRVPAADAVVLRGVELAVGRGGDPGQRGPVAAGPAEPGCGDGHPAGAVRVIESRLAVPAGTRTGRARGYATRAERSARQQRLQALKARLTAAGQRAAAGRVSVVRGGRRLLRARANLTAAGLTEAQWRERWEAGRLFLTADGEKDKAWGNETIRVRHEVAHNE